MLAIQEIKDFRFTSKMRRVPRKGNSPGNAFSLFEVGAVTFEECPDDDKSISEELRKDTKKGSSFYKFVFWKTVGNAEDALIRKLNKVLETDLKAKDNEIVILEDLLSYKWTNQISPEDL